MPPTCEGIYKLNDHTEDKAPPSIADGWKACSGGYEAHPAVLKFAEFLWTGAVGWAAKEIMAALAADGVKPGPHLERLMARWCGELDATYAAALRIHRGALRERAAGG